MVSQAREEYSAAKKRYLNGLDIDVDSVGVPSVCANGIRDNRGEYSVKV